MTLASLAAAGVPLADVSRELEKLGVPFAQHAGEIEVSGVRALRVKVERAEQQAHRSFPRSSRS